MKRLTSADRDRAVRTLAILTGGLTVSTIAATGVATALAAAETHQRDALKLAANAALARQHQPAAATTSAASKPAKSTHVYSTTKAPKPSSTRKATTRVKSVSTKTTTAKKSSTTKAPTTAPKTTAPVVTPTPAPPPVTSAGS